MVTEIITFCLKADASLSDPSSPASKVVANFLATGFAPHGAHNAYYGQYIEKPETGIIFRNWDSLEAHKKFMSLPNYDSHVDHLRSIVDKENAITVLHVPFSPANDPSPVLGANSKVGATEVVFFYFPSSLTDTGKEDIMASVDKVRPIVERSESLAVSDGWALEEKVPNPGPQASDGEMSKVFINLVGWVDVEAHMRFQGSQDFKENIHHLLGIKDLRHMELYHTKLFAA